MTSPLPGIRVQPAVAESNAPSRRSFLRYTGASAVLGSLWLASCKKDPPAPAPAVVTSLASFSPTSGMPGTTVTVKGTGFLGTTAVLLGTVAATGFTVVDAATITFSVPAAAPTGAITVTSPSGTATSSTQFTVTATPVVAPTLDTIVNASGFPGTTVLLSGANLLGITAVTIAGIPATSFRVIGANSITLVLPATAQSSTAQAGPIVVTAPGGTATSQAFTILATTVAVGAGDAGVLNYAYALEQLEAAFYTQVRAGAYYTGSAITGAEKQVFEDLYYHEVIHREFFKASITATGLAVLKDLIPDFSSINFSDRTSVLNTAKAFEDLGSAAYIGAGQYITSPAYLYLAGKIASVEARHAALIRDLVSENTFVGNDVVTLTTAGSSSVSTNNGPAGSSLERALSPAEVAAIANTYLALGSKLDVSGIS
ncbi:MAG: hypothetical protein EOO62_09125 [Hymenobacter sp.]|nr:MAG: hypothetical protein EOO62_09125 [Hymenobacter sp.]